MLPINSATGDFWGNESATVKIAEIRAGINTDLRARDAGHGIAADGKVYVDPLADDPDSDKKHARFEVDQGKARSRSTGGDHVLLLKSRWAQFCDNPQDEAAFIKKHRASDRMQTRDHAVSAAASIEDSIPEIAVDPPKPEKQGLRQTYKKVEPQAVGTD